MFTFSNGLHCPKNYLNPHIKRQYLLRLRRGYGICLVSEPDILCDCSKARIIALQSAVTQAWFFFNAQIQIILGTVHHQLYLGNFYRTFSIIRKCCKVFIIQKITKIQKIQKHSSFLNLLHIQTFVLCHYYTGSVFSSIPHFR